MTWAVEWRIGSSGVVGAGVEQLVDRAALGRLEVGLVLVGTASLAAAASALSSAIVVPPENQTTSRPDRTRGSTSRGSTRLHGRRALPRRVVRSRRANGRTRAGSPAAHGWCRHRSFRRGLQPMAPALWRRPGGRVPIDALLFSRPGRWWAILDSNQ